MENKRGKPRRNQLSDRTKAKAPHGSMPFVVSTNDERIDPVTRKLIRSHVMRGKKWKRKNIDDGWVKNLEVRKDPIQAVRVQPERLKALYTPLVLDRIGTDLSFLPVADGAESHMLLNAFKVTPFVMRIMFPLIMSIGFKVDETQWLHQVANDAAALHITAFAIEGFIDRVLRHQKECSNPTAMLHLQTGLHLLKDRLVNGIDAHRVSNTTIGTVLKLAGASHFNGCHEETKHHLEGIQKMVELRGGLHMLDGTSTQAEILRSDLSHAVLNCALPVFQSQTSSTFPYPKELLPRPDHPTVSHIKDLWFASISEDLRTVWLVMAKFCSFVNLGSQTHRFISPQKIHQTMASVTYRLLSMKFPVGSLNDTISLGLIAFSYHVFMQWQDTKPPHARFPTRYRDRVLDMDFVSRSEDGSRELMLWLLMVGAVSVWDLERDVALRACWRYCVEKGQIRRWKELQDILKKLMWIPLLDAERGEQIYRQIVS